MGGASWLGSMPHCSSDAGALRSSHACLPPSSTCTCMRTHVQLGGCPNRLPLPSPCAQYCPIFCPRAPQAGSASDGEEELDAQTALDLLDLGIVSPVTRETAGSLYHKELARQVGWAACGASGLVGRFGCGSARLFGCLHGHQCHTLPGTREMVRCGHVSRGCHAMPGPPFPPSLTQLADFLRVPLERAGGMMPLPDVYCMYNR